MRPDCRAADRAEKSRGAAFSASRVSNSSGRGNRTNVSLSGVPRGWNVAIDGLAEGRRAVAVQKRRDLAHRQPFCVNAETSVTNGGRRRHLVYKP